MPQSLNLGLHQGKSIHLGIHQTRSRSRNRSQAPSRTESRKAALALALALLMQAHFRRRSSCCFYFEKRGIFACIFLPIIILVKWRCVNIKFLIEGPPIYNNLPLSIILWFSSWGTCTWQESFSVFWLLWTISCIHLGCKYLIKVRDIIYF